MCKKEKKGKWMKERVCVCMVFDQEGSGLSRGISSLIDFEGF